MSKIIARIKAEPLALRAVVASVLNLLVVAGVIDTGASEEAQVIALGVFNLLLFKGARDRVTPSGPPAPVVPAAPAPVAAPVLGAPTGT